MTPARAERLAARDDPQYEEKIRAGGEFFAQEWAACRKICFKAINLVAHDLPEDDKEDLLSVVFKALYENRHKYLARYSFGTWAYATTYRAAVNVVKRDRPQGRRRRLEFSMELFLPDNIVFLYEDPRLMDGLRVGTVKVALDAEIAAHAVLSCVTAPQERRALWLKEGEGMATGDVADLMGISLPAVRNYVKRAKDAVKRAYPTFEALCERIGDPAPL